jgi:hemolysin activation/secretion protein
VFPTQAFSLNTATADSLSATTIDSPQIPIPNPKAPFLPQNERQPTLLNSLIPTTALLQSPSLQSTPQAALCSEITSAGESANSPNTITVSRFEFVVDRPVFTEEELNSFTRDYLNKALSNAQLLSAAAEITKQYAARGYITSSAVVCIPSQTQQRGKGAVIIQVIEGKLERIDVKSPPSNSSRTESSLQPQTPNEAKSFNASLSIDSFQGRVVLGEANLLRIGDSLSVGYSRTEATNDWDFSYTLPLNARDGTLSFAYYQSETKALQLPFDDIHGAGNSSDYELAFRSYELTLRQPVRRSVLGESDRLGEQQLTSEELALGLTAFLGESSTTSSKVPFPLSSWPDDNGLTRIFALRFFQEWIWQNAQDSIELRSQFSFGLDAFGSTINESLAQANQVIPNNRFFSWQGMAQWTRNLAQDTLLLVLANAQLADRALVPSEQFALGGQGSVRGYLQDFLLTDNGIKASAEVQLPVLRVFRGNGVIQVVPFVDWGMVWNSSGQANPSPNSLASVGLGLQWQQGDFTARLDWGIPLVSVDSIDGTGQESGVYFSVQYNR